MNPAPDIAALPLYDEDEVVAVDPQEGFQLADENFVLVIYREGGEKNPVPILDDGYGEGWRPRMFSARMVGDGIYEADSLKYPGPFPSLYVMGCGISRSTNEVGEFREMFGHTKGCTIEPEDTFHIGEGVFRFTYA